MSMAKNRRPRGYSGPQANQSMSSNNYQYEEKPVSNSLYPEPRPLFGDNSQENTNNFGDVNKPPWQRNRDGSEAFPDDRNNPAPWNRNRTSDTWGSSPADSSNQNQNSRQEPPWSQRNRDSSNTGWNEGPSNTGQQGQDDSNRMNRQESTNASWWKGNSAGQDEERGWGRAGQDEPNNMQRGQSDQYGGPARNWTDGPNDYSKAEWFDRGRGPPGSDWNEGPGSDRMDRNRGSGFGPTPQEGDFGGNRPGEFQDDSWRNRSKIDNQGGMNRGGNDGDPWRERRLDGPPRMDRSRNDDGNWPTPPRGRDIGNREISDRYRNRSRDYRWDDNSGPIRPLMDTPITDPMNERKRFRSPDNRDMWQQPEPLMNRFDGPSDRFKRPRFADSPDVRMQEISDRERREMAFRSGFIGEDFDRFDYKPDLRDKLISSRSLETPFDRRDIPLGMLDPDQSYKVIIIPRTRFLRFNDTDSKRLEKHLIETLHKLASTENYEKQPQLRFDGVAMSGKRRMIVRCKNRETAEWLLSWTPVGQRFKMRIIMQKDPQYLAIITFATKVKYSLSLDEIKQFLKFQNPGLEVWNWRQGTSKPSPKGTMSYSFVVDGHTIRYLMNHKWELFFGMEKLYIRRFKTNFGDLQALQPILI